MCEAELEGSKFPCIRHFSPLENHVPILTAVTSFNAIYYFSDSMRFVEFSC